MVIVMNREQAKETLEIQRDFFIGSKFSDALTIFLDENERLRGIIGELVEALEVVNHSTHGCLDEAECNYCGARQSQECRTSCSVRVALSRARQELTDGEGE
jgi:hypothetical protein